jgi:hypothetical protein
VSLSLLALDKVKEKMLGRGCLVFTFWLEREREWYGMDVGKNENGGAFINNGGKKRKGGSKVYFS